MLLQLPTSDLLGEEYLSAASITSFALWVLSSPSGTHMKGIIDAADKYSIVNLKLEAEAAYVKYTTITMENVMDNLLYAACRICIQQDIHCILNCYRVNISTIASPSTSTCSPRCRCATIFLEQAIATSLVLRSW